MAEETQGQAFSRGFDFELRESAVRGRPRACAAPAACGRPPTTSASRGCRWPDSRRRTRPARPNWGCRVCAVAITPLPIVRWPATPTWPASVTPSSIIVLPAMPTCAASSTFRPRRDAVGDLDEVVDLGAGADARLADGRPIDRRVRADLHVVFDDDAADLRDLLVGAVAAMREAEAVAADDGAVLQDDAVADTNTLADRDVGVDDAVVANLRKASDRHVRVHDGACADPRALGHRRERDRMLASGAIVAPGSTYARRCTTAGGRHSSANSATARANVRYGSSARSTAHGSVGDPGAAMTADACVFRSSSRYLRLEKKVRSPAAACVERGDAGDLDVAVALESTGEPRGNVAQLHVDTALRSKKLTRCSSLSIS